MPVLAPLSIHTAQSLAQLMFACQVMLRPQLPLFPLGGLPQLQGLGVYLQCSEGDDQGHTKSGQGDKVVPDADSATVISKEMLLPRVEGPPDPKCLQPPDSDVR